MAAKAFDRMIHEAAIGAGKPFGLLAVLFSIMSIGYLSGCKTPARYKLSPGAVAPPSSRMLTVKLRPQERTNWCWAASGEMIMETLGHDVAQCTQAENLFSKSCCPSKVSCDDTGWPQFDKYAFTYKRTNSAALDWDQLREQIGVRGAPIAFTWLFPDGTGHMMVLKGYANIDGVNYVYVDDPWYVPEPGKPNQGREEFFTYQWYVKDPAATNCDAPDGQRLGDHCQWDDFYDFSHP